MKKPPSRTADQFVVRFPEGMRDRIADAAKANNRSMNAEIIQRLEHSFTPHEERPWEERMVTDVNRAMLALLSSDEFSILLDRVKHAGGAEVVNKSVTPRQRNSTDDDMPKIVAQSEGSSSGALSPSVQAQLDALVAQNQELRQRLDEVFEHIIKTFKFDRDAMENQVRKQREK